MRAQILKKQKMQRILHVLNLQKKILENQLAVLNKEKDRENQTLMILNEQNKRINLYNQNEAVTTVSLEQKRLYAELLKQGIQQQHVKAENISKRVNQFQNDWILLKNKIQKIDEKILELRQLLA
ncbi:MAG: hypothetical protein V4629_05320 [Pseudomonadota bacterium]